VKPWLYLPGARVLLDPSHTGAAKRDFDGAIPSQTETLPESLPARLCRSVPNP
jgi:hypothetical protein